MNITEYEAYNTNELINIMKAVAIGHLAIVDENEYPRIVAVNFVFHESM